MAKCMIFLEISLTLSYYDKRNSMYASAMPYHFSEVTTFKEKRKITHRDLSTVHGQANDPVNVKDSILRLAH